MIRQFQIEHFDLWFCRYLRRIGKTRAEYAEIVGLDIKTIDGICNGTLRPTSKILNDMGVTIRSLRVDTCIWDDNFCDWEDNFCD